MPYVYCEQILSDAVFLSYNLWQCGRAVLYSPFCSSFDQMCKFKTPFNGISLVLFSAFVIDLRISVARRSSMCGRQNM